MDEFYALPEARRQIIFQEAGTRLGLPASSIEKDWWVTRVLESLFSSQEIAPLVTFKGGTSLSKAFNLIRRFSEDIDLVIDRKSLAILEDQDPESAPSGRKRKLGVKQVKHSCAEYIKDRILPMLRADFDLHGLSDATRIEVDPLDSEQHTVLVQYKSLFTSGAGRYTRPAVKVELEARSEDEPSLQREIQSIAAQEFSDASWAHAVSVRTLDPARTFIEKACLLHEENMRPPDKNIKVAMSRHIYDLHLMMDSDFGKRACTDRPLLDRILKNRRIYFEYTWLNYEKFGPGYFKFVPPADRIGFWRDDYRSLCENMVFGGAPEFSDLMDSLAALEIKLNNK